MTLAVVVFGGYAMFRLDRRDSSPLGWLAWRAAQAAGRTLLRSVLVYQKPQSFYTNFVPVGKAADGGIAAELVAAGDRQSYLEGLAHGRLVALWLGRGFTGIGALTLLVGAGLALLEGRGSR